MLPNYQQVKGQSTNARPEKPQEPTKDKYGAAICCCFDDGPQQDDPYARGVRSFRVPMCDSCCEEPLCCIGSFLCLPCAQYKLRKQVLNNDMNRYACCQHYFDSFYCCVSGSGCGEERCPNFCLATESLCCPGLAVSASRMTVMDQEMLYSDPCDRRIIVFSNCLQCLACVCDIAAIFIDDLREAARIVDVAAHCVFLCTAACMTAQVYHELKYIVSQKEPDAPPKQDMI